MTTEAGRSLLPSDFFNHAYQAKTGGVLDEETFQSLANATRELVSRARITLRPRNTRDRSASIAATRIAYAARRDATQPFGPYEFAYAQPPAEPIQLCVQAMGRRVESSRRRLAGGNRGRVAMAGGHAELAASGRHLGPSLAGRVVARMPRAKLDAAIVLPVLLGGGRPRSLRACANRARAAGIGIISVVGPGVGAGPDGRARPGRNARAASCRTGNSSASSACRIT